MTPVDVQRQLNEALQAYSSGDLGRAAMLLEGVLRATPNDVNALHMLGRVRKGQGSFDDALALCDRALAFAPGNVALMASRAAVLTDMERWAEALVGYESALQRGADRTPIWMGRGHCLDKLQRAAEAAESFRRATALEPGNADAWFNLGRTLQTCQRHVDAAEAYQRAVSVRSDDLDARDNLGVALHQSDRFDEALVQFDEVLRRDPGRAETWSNRGLLLFDRARPAEAIASFDRALALAEAHGASKASLVSLHYNRAMAHMRGHELQAGWSGFELRWRAKDGNDEPAQSEPRWRGGSLPRALRIWREQGVGDEILLSRLVPFALRRTPRIVLDCDLRLAPLFARSFPEIVVGADGTSCETQIAIGSLGPVLDVSASNLGGEAFLRADPARVAALRAKYVEMARSRSIVGIAWSSNNPTRGALKTASLASWSQLLERDYFFVNLQYGEAAEEGAAFGIYADPEIDQIRDLDGFAAQIAALDRVVSISNTTVHMAGALGVPCIVMPPPGRGRLWYWGYEGETTPWYKSVRIVRRALDEDWSAQIARAAALLP